MSNLLLCVKACGGSISHWINPETGKALCGDAPKNRSAGLMRKRAKWMRWIDQSVVGKNICAKCTKRKEG